MSLTVGSIPPANFAIRHIVSKLRSMCRSYHVAIRRLMPKAMTVLGVLAMVPVLWHDQPGCEMS
jgi:Cu/Ag efflux pump CusA